MASASLPWCAGRRQPDARWTVRLIAEEAVKRKLVEQVSPATVHILLQSHDLKPWREKGAEGGAAFSQARVHALGGGVRRLSGWHSCRTSGRDDHSFGSGQPEHAWPQIARRAVWRETGQSALGPLHGSLYAQARQLAQSSRNRSEPAQSLVLGKTQNPRLGHTAQRSSRLQHSSKPQSHGHSMELHPQTSSAETPLLIHENTVLACIIHEA
jgi:hypothetical protein